ncbi:MAG: hypothetical protein ACRDN0_11420 [Trebonia sp.]
MHYDQLSMKERAALFALIAGENPVSNPKLKERVGFTLDGKERRRLNDLKLVESNREPGRAFVHELTDAGWRWVADELDLPRRAGAGSLESAFHAVLADLGRYLRASGLTLADFFKASHEAASAEAPHEPADVEDGILSAYRAVAAEPAQFVKLTDLRQRLADVPRAEVDAALDRMYRSRRINLIPESGQRLLTAEDRTAALRIGGEAKHLISEVRR